MMAARPIWAEFIIHDNMGNVIGIREDAPQEAKQAYSDYKAKEDEYAKKGEFIPR